jgi:transketolase
MHVLTRFVADLAVVGKKVIDFYKKRGGEVVSPLVRAL